MPLDFNNTEVSFRHKSDKDLRHARFLFSFLNFPILAKAGMILTKWAISWNFPVRGVIKSTIFKQFCGGETMEEAALTALALGEYNIGVILDYGVEGKEREDEFDKTVFEFIRIIKYAASQKNIHSIALKVTGFGRFDLLEKIHSGRPLLDNEKAEWDRVFNRIEKICRTAFENNIAVLIDAEETWIQNPINQLTNAMMEKYNKGEAVIFNTFQMYCLGKLEYLKQSFEEASSKGYILGAKLVRGAYMEKERKRAKEKRYLSPIQPNKAGTNKDYDEALLFCLRNLDKISLFAGTHNEISCSKFAQYMEGRGIPQNHPRACAAQLYGMGDNISFNMAHEGYNVAKYLPYGPVKDVISYLMRRAQENMSALGQTGRELLLINKEIKRRSGS